MEKQAKARRKQTGYEACELTKVNNEVLCAVRVGFMPLWMLLSEVQIIEKNREQTKKYSGIILGSILPKNERTYQNIGVKKKKY